MTSGNIKGFMESFCLDQGAKDRLPSVTQALVNEAAKHNRSARMATYAFLDEAYGHQDWKAERVQVSTLRELRKYNLRADTIREPWHIDARYGAFFGRADFHLLERIVHLVHNEPTHPLHSVAEWSLESLCEQFPHIAAAVNSRGFPA